MDEAFEKWFLDEFVDDPAASSYEQLRLAWAAATERAAQVAEGWRVAYFRQYGKNGNEKMRAGGDAAGKIAHAIRTGYSESSPLAEHIAAAIRGEAR